MFSALIRTRSRSLRKSAIAVLALLVFCLNWAGVPLSRISASWAQDSIETLPYPGEEQVPYKFTFTLSEDLPADDALQIVFPEAYRPLLHPSARFADEHNVELNAGEAYVTAKEADWQAAKPWIKLHLSQPLEAGTKVVVSLLSRLGITNPTAGTYFFQIGRAGGTPKTLPVGIIDGTSVAALDVVSDPPVTYLASGEDAVIPYTLSFRPQAGLVGADKITIEIPSDYRPASGYWWEYLNKELPLSQVKASVNGSEAPALLEGAFVRYDFDRYYLDLTLAGGSAVQAGDTVDLKLGFLKNPLNWNEAGYRIFRVLTTKDLLPQAVKYPVYGSGMTHVVIESGSDVVSADGGYKSALRANRSLSPADRIYFELPQGFELPAWLAPGTIRINGEPASYNNVDGRVLTVSPSGTIPGFARVAVDIPAGAGFKNPAQPGIYEFRVRTSIDPDTWGRGYNVGFIPADGSAVKDLRVDFDVEVLKFMMSPNIGLKAGDTLTLTGPSGFALTPENVRAGQISVMAGEGIGLPAAAVERPSPNEVVITLSDDFRIASGEWMTVMLPPVSEPQQYGNYVFGAKTSREGKAAAFTYEVKPSEPYGFAVTPEKAVAGRPHVPYAFRFHSSDKLRAGGEFPGMIALYVPEGVKLPAFIQPGHVTVNGEPAADVSIDAVLRKIGVTVPLNIDIGQQVDVLFKGTAAFGNPDEAGVPYTFRLDLNEKDYRVNDEVTYTAPQAVVRISGPDEVTIPNGTEAPATAVYSAQVYNEDGSPLGGGVKWSLASPVQGVAVDEETGVVTVSRLATAGAVELRAVSKQAYHGEKPADSLTVKLRSPGQVPPDPSLPWTMKFETAAVQLQPGDTYRSVVSTVYGEGGASWDVTSYAWFGSSDEAVAVVAADGVVTARAVGAAVVTATYGGRTASLQVNVQPAADRLTGLAFQYPGTLPLPTGEAYASVLTATYASGLSVKVPRADRYTSGNTAVATVDEHGVITGHHLGKTSITAAFGQRAAVLEVEVLPSAKSLLDASGDGKVDLDEIVGLLAKGKLYDLNRDGKIDAADAEIVLQLIEPIVVRGSKP